MSESLKTNKPRCPNRRCSRLREFNHVLCRECWSRVDKSVRDRVWLLYETAPGSAGHRRAVFLAIEQATNATEKPSHQQQEFF